MPEVIGAAAVAALPNHPIQSACAQARIAGERVLDERHIRLDHRGPGDEWRFEACVCEHPPHGVAMDFELPAQSADAPPFDVIQPQDLGLELARDHAPVPDVSTPDLSAPVPAAGPCPLWQRRATNGT